MPSLAQQIREAQTQAENWKRYSRTRTCLRKHEVLHAIVMAACWRKKLRQLKQGRMVKANARRTA